jgi:hypothetical protein
VEPNLGHLSRHPQGEDILQDTPLAPQLREDYKTKAKSSLSVIKASTPTAPFTSRGRVSTRPRPPFRLKCEGFQE